MNANITEQDEEDAALWVARHMGGPVDATAFAQWVDGKAGRRELFDAMWATCMDQSVTASLQQLDETPTVAPVAANDGRPAARSMRRVMALGAVAAVLMLAAAFAWLPMSGMFSPSERYQTAAGEVREVRLADGSLVVLNGASTIEVSLRDDAREVTLSAGEALFDVAHDARRPFSVAAGAGEVRVLGTRFDLALNGDRVELEVSRGLVRFGVAGDDETAVLVRRDQRSTLLAGAPTAPVNFAAHNESEWRRGWVEVADMPLAQLIPRLERWTVKSIELDDRALLERRVTGRFMLSQPEAVLSGLGAVHGFRVSETETSFLIERP